MSPVQEPDRREHDDLRQRVGGRDAEHAGDRPVGSERPPLQRERLFLHSLGGLPQSLGSLGEPEPVPSRSKSVMPRSPSSARTRRPTVV